jgi:hypothetical protein
MSQHKPAKSRNTCDPEIPNDLNFSLERWMISTVVWIKFLTFRAALNPPRRSASHSKVRWQSLPSATVPQDLVP